jgi:hypothetical protein
MKNKLFFVFVFMAGTASAQLTPQAEQELFKKLASLDSSLFVTAYTCNPEKNVTFFTEDIEFYHDKGGPTYTRKAFMESMTKNFCAPRKFELRRKLVSGTLQLFPMYNNNVLYAAVQMGEHKFYEYDPATKKETWVGIAKFTHLWENKEGDWKISRVLSYDHRAAK